MTPPPPEIAARRATVKYRRAKMRHFVLTITADRVTGGRLIRRHLAQPVEPRELELRCAGWPAAFDGLRIAHVSDFHVGHLMPVERAVAVLEQVRSLKPDLIACTGDVVDLESDHVAPVLAALGGAGAPLGSFLVLGNHDHLDDAPGVAKLARAAGVRVLDDEVAELRSRDGILRVGGVDWGRTIRECANRVGRAWRRGRGIHLLLSHNPKSFVAAARLGVPLTLAGHTHGGQIAVARRPRTNLAFTHRLNAGVYERDASTLFVTVGLGAWFPLRVNCPPEIAMLTVRGR